VKVVEPVLQAAAANSCAGALAALLAGVVKSSEAAS